MKQKVLDEVTRFFIASSDFNGIPLSSIVSFLDNKKEALSIVNELVKEGAINCTFSSKSINPHIKRIPDFEIKDQLKFLKSEPIGRVCIYPSASVVKSSLDISEYDNKPFYQKLLLGKSQLDYEAFDLAVLERYFKDPRYQTKFGDFSGQISIGSQAYEDPEFPERDKVLLETFGLGYDENKSKVVIVFLRYLCRMSSDHQQYWNSFLWAKQAVMCEEYYRTSIIGTFPEFGSIQKAITYELRAINQILKSIGEENLFKEDFIETLPFQVSLFTRITLDSFNEFVETMDKILSENIDKKFFKGVIPLEFEEKRKDGKIVIKEKGTLLLLDEWLRARIEWQDCDKAIELIVGPMRQIRQLRQKPAHKLEKNKLMPDLDKQKKELLFDIGCGLLTLRAALEKHSDACEPELPRFIKEGKVKYF